LRELFLLVALVAMGCGWWADRRAEQQRLATAIEKASRFEAYYTVLKNALDDKGYDVVTGDSRNVFLRPRPQKEWVPEKDPPIP
jgi:hypothetical protein